MQRLRPARYDRHIGLPPSWTARVVGDSGLPVPIGTGRQRALLALLLLRANELVASERLVDELWGGSPPSTAPKMLQNQVSALRRALGRNGRLETHGRGYRLNVGPGERDIDRFEGLVAAGRATIESDPEAAAETLRQALALWRGHRSPTLLRAVRSGRRRPLGGAALGRVGGERGRRARAGEARRPRAGAGVGHRGAAPPRAPARSADAGAVPLRPPVRGARGLPPGAAHARGGDRRRARRRAPSACTRRSSRRIRRSTRPPGPEELPAALQGGSPILAGRSTELAALTTQLIDACEGRTGVVLLSGPRGSGKTRLVAELAREARRRRMLVVYARAKPSPTRHSTPCVTRRPASARCSSRSTARTTPPRRSSTRPRRSPATALICCCLRSCTSARRRPPAFAAHAPHTIELGPLGNDGDRGDSPLVRLGRQRNRRARGGDRRPPAGSPSRRSGTGAGTRLARGGGERRTRGRRARRASGGGDGALRRPARARDGRRARPPLRRRGGRRAAAGGLPVPRPGHVRRGARCVLLRPGAPRRRAGRPARRVPAARGRGPIREREVLGGAGRSASGSRGRRPPGLGEMVTGRSSGRGRIPSRRSRMCSRTTAGTRSSSSISSRRPSPPAATTASARRSWMRSSSSPRIVTGASRW